MSFGETALGVVDSRKARVHRRSTWRGKSRVRSRSANQAAVLIERSILTLGTLRICPKKLPKLSNKSRSPAAWSVCPEVASALPVTMEGIRESRIASNSDRASIAATCHAVVPRLRDQGRSAINCLGYSTTSSSCVPSTSTSLLCVPSRLIFRSRPREM